MAPKIAVVIGTLNRPHVVSSLLHQLEKTSEIEVLVFDQSNKENYQTLKKSFPKKTNYILIHLDSPNTCHYLNMGWKKAKAPIVLYLDDDVEITPETISAHLSAYKNNEVHGVAGRVINDSETISNDSRTGKIYSFGAIFLKNFSSESRGSVDFPYGCNMSFRKKTLEMVGGFDEKLSPPIYSFNEVDLGYRINKQWPKSIIFEPDALAYHKRYPSGGGRTFDAKTLEAGNSFNYGYFIGKNFSLFENILWAVRRLPYQILKEPNKIFSILKGFLSAKKRRLTKEYILLFFVFTLIFFLRFWQVPRHFFFGIDEEYQSLLALSIIKDFHIIWIGLSAANTGFYIAPGFVYLHSLFLWISRLDPVILGYAASTVSFITILIFYYVVKHLFDKKSAIITTLIYSFSTFVMSYDRRFWNSTFVPPTAVLFFLSLVKSEKNPKWYLLTAILLGLSFHIHASLFIFIPITILVLCYRIFIVKQKIPIIYHLLSIILFLILYFPLIVYDFVHNFDNLKTPFRMLKQLEKGGGGYSFLQHFQTIQSTIQQFWSSDSFSSLVNYSLLALIAIIFLWFFLKKKNMAEDVLAFIIILYALIFLFYPGTILDYYFIGFFPFFSIVIALFLTQFYQLSLIALTAIFILPNITAFFQSPVDGNLELKKLVVQKTIRALRNEPFYLETAKPYVYFGGWRYLFEAYGKKPSASQADTMFGWIYPKEISSEKPKLNVLITINPKFQPNKIIIKKIILKPYTVFISSRATTEESNKTKPLRQTELKEE